MAKHQKFIREEDPMSKNVTKKVELVDYDDPSDPLGFIITNDEELQHLTADQLREGREIMGRAVAKRIEDHELEMADDLRGWIDMFREAHGRLPKSLYEIARFFADRYNCGMFANKERVYGLYGASANSDCIAFFDRVLIRVELDNAFAPRTVCLGEPTCKERSIWAYYTGGPDQRDEEIESIFAEHDGKSTGSGYYFPRCRRDISAIVPADRAEACIAALSAETNRAVVVSWGMPQILLK
jgi:hypothetical protein